MSIEYRIRYVDGIVNDSHTATPPQVQKKIPFLVCDGCGKDSEEDPYLRLWKWDIDLDLCEDCLTDAALEQAKHNCKEVVLNEL